MHSEKFSTKIKALLTNINDDIKLVYEEIKPYVNGYYKFNVYNKLIKELPLPELFPDY